MAGKITYRGVRVRGDTVEINFSWMGKTRYVTVPGLKPTKQGIKQAFALREIIKLEIKTGAFSWSKHFPDHKLAKTEHLAMSNYTVAELLKDWLKTQKGRISSGYHEKSTYKVENILIPVFGHIPVTLLTPGHIRDWAIQLDVAKSTVKNYLTPLRSSIRDAIADSRLAADPLRELVLPKEKMSVTQRVEQRREEVNPYSYDEEHRILKKCSWEQERNLFEFAFWTGVRPGELIALEWKHVDLQRKTAFICQAISGDELSDIKTKAKGRREIMLLPNALDALKRQRAISTMLPQGRVFVDRGLKPFSNYNQLWTCFFYACTRAGVINRGIGQTRHTFASRMLMDGEDESWVAKMLGHTTVEMIRRHYRKFIRDNTTTGYSLKSDWKQSKKREKDQDEKSGDNLAF